MNLIGILCGNWISFSLPKLVGSFVIAFDILIG